MIDSLDYTILWIIFGLFVGICLAIDLGLFGKLRAIITKKQSIKEFESVMPIRQALLWSITWITLAGIFAVLILFTMGQAKMMEFVTGYVLEKTLSVDNMFVFLLIFTSLGIPYKYQHRVLSIGVISAIAMRIPLILIGAALLDSFHWMLYVFGGLILLTAFRMIIQKNHKKIDLEKNLTIKLLKRFIPVDLNIQSQKFFTRKNGILFATPLVVALIMIEMTDLIFAVDSIPAVLAITQDTFIVITSNIFAILGLRSLYFLLAGVLEKLHYLKYGLVALLMFIGVKMLLSDAYKIPIEISLSVVAIILAISLGFSLFRMRSLKNPINESEF